jgi:hypothetical protein
MVTLNVEQFSYTAVKYRKMYFNDKIKLAM